MYAKIVNNKVVGVANGLPSSHEGVSGFNTLSDAEAAAYGFLPLVEVKPALAQHTIPFPAGANGADNNVYLPTEAYGQPIDTVSATAVARSYPVVQRTTIDINADICKLRAAAYPPLSDAEDARVKMDSNDPVMQAAGVLQRSNYVNACLAVKHNFPKV